MAIQLNAVKLADCISLVCTSVLGEVRLGLVDEDEEIQEVTDRTFLEKQSSNASLGTANGLLSIVKPFDPAIEMKGNGDNISFDSILE